ncbi:DUF6463 domain-containing protein [Saccharomonospora xinjiangensis]|nr:hypothetical protein EYD13_06425 [Saccharomonospora xinjiangensis]
MVVLGAGHLMALVAITGWSELTTWFDEGLWAAVPFLERGTPPTVASLHTAVAFWSGLGSFAVPLVLLGLLIRHAAGHGTAVPAVIGWALIGWFLLAGVLLGPSPFFAGIVPGVLVVLATRKPDREPG